MRGIALILLLASTTAMAEPQRQAFKDANGRTNTTYYDSMGRNTGRSVTDSRGNTTFYDNMGRNTGRSVTQGNVTTVYDNMGRQTGTVRSR